MPLLLRSAFLQRRAAATLSHAVEHNVQKVVAERCVGRQLVMTLADKNRPSDREIAAGCVRIQAVARQQTCLGDRAVPRLEHQFVVSNPRNWPLDLTRLQGDVGPTVDFLQQARRRTPPPSESATGNFELAASTPEGIVGRTVQMRGILERIALVAPTQATVLITGESGTGKELAARAIHRLSRRGDKPFIKVNCSTVPRELFESEFFGHVKGAYTGAISDRRGRFELADGGTLFLDEIGELPIEMQSKLLGVLEEGRFERVGDARSREVNVRIVAATNRDPEAEIGAGRFRLDLYYRLSVFPVHIPPLRARRDDIPLLVEHMLAAALRRAGRGEEVLSDEQMSRLTAYDWPGNVRELQNVIECAVISARDGEPLRFDLPASSPDVAAFFGPAEGPGILNESQRKEIERNSIVTALRRTGGRIGGPGGAAEFLGVRPTTLRSRMKAFDIEIATVVSVQGGEGHAELGASNVESRAGCADVVPAPSFRRGPISLVK